METKPKTESATTVQFVGGYADGRIVELFGPLPDMYRCPVPDRTRGFTAPLVFDPARLPQEDDYVLIPLFGKKFYVERRLLQMANDTARTTDNPLIGHLAELK